MKTYLVFQCVLAILHYQNADALTCYECHGSISPSECNTTTTCSANQACFQQTTHTSSGFVFELGCQDNQLCGGSASTGGANLVGRNVHDLYKRQSTSNCHECCTREMCNTDLCSHLKPSSCVDDETIDCAQLSSLLDICNDINHAKIICPKFCGLCNLVDGVWSPWNNWSSCDVTCGMGTQSRLRTCTNPPPANGGLDCIGNRTDVKQCVKDACPIHGGWSMWSSWGACSVTCDVGIQRRERSCSNPHPDQFGDHCFGVSRDDRICMSHPCTDGGWSSWQQWESCSVTCGGGIKRRHRSCDNPTPSAFGRSCIGTDEHTEMCNNVGCRDGGWSPWQQWEACSMTCGGGLKRRYRSCDNPAPSTFGRPCTGTDEHTEICNNVGCRDNTIGFHVNHVNESSLDTRCIFNTILINDGNGYDINTGFFTAPVPGLYLFTASLGSKPSTHLYFGITKGSNDTHYQTLTSVLGHEGASVYDCTFTSALTRLEANEKVAVRLTTSGKTDSLAQYSNMISTFTGTKLAT